MDQCKYLSYDTVVIGGGQCGLAAGYYLKRAGRSFLVVDANQRSGDTWRQRWDSLRLFSPAQYDGLPGLPFPAPRGTFPTKDQMADYLDQYSAHFGLPILRSSRAIRVSPRDGAIVVECEDRSLCASNVIVATGAYTRSQRPDFAGRLDPSIQQMHSSEYRRPADVHGDSVLVAGFATSGIEIAIELAQAGRRVILSGRSASEFLSKFLPKIFSASNPLLRLAGKAHWNFVHRVVTIRTPIGRKAKKETESRGKPLIRFNRSHAIAAGVEPAPRVSGVKDGRPYLEDGRTLDVSAVVWCTGGRPECSFLDFPGLEFDAHGCPVAPFGVAPNVRGLYFVGMPFQIGLTSTLVGGAGRDAEFVVRHIEQHVSAASHAPCGLRTDGSASRRTDKWIAPPLNASQ
jgi:putative flavoprotein involved in K+ transport